MGDKLIKCRACEKEIAKSAKACPYCGAKRPLYRRTWFIVTMSIILFFILIAVFFGDELDDEYDGDRRGHRYQKNKNVTVEVVDMSKMTEAEVDKWAEDKKINVVRKKEYSDSVKKGEYINQSIEAKKSIYEGDKLILTYSLGKKPTKSEENALMKAEVYSTTLNMSKQGIYDQLISSVEGFSRKEAQYAIDNIEANWNENALQKARRYQNNMKMSKQAIYNQLTSSFEGFTKKEAQYAIDNLED